MEVRWVMKERSNIEKVNKLSQEVKVSPIIAELLVSRGIDSFELAERFFRPKLEDVHSPFLFSQMKIAVQALHLAISKNKKVFLYGDYDVDGTSAVAIMYNVLSKHTKNIEFYIPDRYSEGYGLSKIGTDYMIKNKGELVITLDCGIRSVERISELRNAGLEVIVCDHHESGSELPNAILLDPKIKDESYPFNGLSGAGVGFKLLEALHLEYSLDREVLNRQLDLLALSIAADIVPVTDENRIYAFEGLKLMNKKLRPSFEKMFLMGNRKGEIKLSDLVFGLAPRINAAGRIRTGMTAVQCMLDESIENIDFLVTEIEADNNQRKVLDQAITIEALDFLSKENENRKSNVLFSKNWHKGVVGIVASRIIEKYPLPTIVLTESSGVLSGSARTVGGFDIHEALTSLSHLLLQFGGHQHAAGLTLSTDKFEDFKEAFDQLAKVFFTENPLDHTLMVDAEINLDHVFIDEPSASVPRLVRIIDGFEPFGPGNPKPIFCSKQVYAVQSRVLKAAHLKMNVLQLGSKRPLDAIAFNSAHKNNETAPGLSFSIAYTFDINEFNNQKKLQLMIKDIKGEEV